MISGKHHLIEVSAGNFVHAVEFGPSRAERSPVVLLHGNRDNSTHFEVLLPHLQGRRVIMIDLRGHGLSSPLREVPTPRLLAEDVSAVIAKLCDEPVRLAGHSLGSVVAVTLASRVSPEQVESVALMGSAATFEHSFRRPQTPTSEADFPAFLIEANKRAAPVFFTVAHPEVARRVTATWSTVSFETHRHLVGLQHPDLRADIPKLPGDLTVVAGAEDRCTPVEKARWIADHHPSAKLHVIDGAGHFMYLENPAAVGAALRER